MDKKPELLAPAGNVESFFTAVENGADAIYLGLKKFNARATASNFTLDELSTLIPFAHSRSVRIYTTLNSQIAGSEIAELLDTLHALSQLKPDALIVQDAALFYLVRNYFPGLKLHASTLAAVHNSAGVNSLERMGASRVVLARELSLSEIELVCANTKAELEIFVHGALCYSWSGLCLASSFRGGRSGLRGECVQPCRLRFRQGKKEGFYLSCNDLCALPMLPALKKLRIAGFKIEGRMKPASYIGPVVRAYRMVLDAASSQDEQEALNEAAKLLSKAPSRQLTLGHLKGEGAASEILRPHRSGSSGIWIGTVKSVQNGRALVDLRHEMEKGDRLRPESSGKEEGAFTVGEFFDQGGAKILRSEAGTRVLLICPAGVSSGDRLFKVGTKSESPAVTWKKIGANTRPIRFKSKFPGRDKVAKELFRSEVSGQGGREVLLVKVGSTDDLVRGLQSSADFALLVGSRRNLELIAKQRFSAIQMKKVGISLPALLAEAKDIPYYRAAVGWFVGKGFRTWEINNWGHLDFFPDLAGLRLIGGAGLNLRNEAALAQAKEMGCSMSALSLEITRSELDDLAQSSFGAKSIVTLFSWPPLFTSRLVPELAEEKVFVTPRKDAYHLTRRAGNVFIYADKPTGIIDELPGLRSRGFRRFMIDVSEGPGKQTQALEKALSGFFLARLHVPSFRFNFDRRL